MSSRVGFFSLCPAQPSIREENVFILVVVLVLAIFAIRKMAFAMALGGGCAPPRRKPETELKHFLAVLHVVLRLERYDEPTNRKGLTPMKRNLITFAAAALSLCMALGVGAAAAFAEARPYVFSYDDMFTKRDLKQTADLKGAVEYIVTDGQDIHIAEAGVYVLTGNAQNATVYVEAGKDDKVQLVLDGLTIINQDAPAVYVKSADKVFVTTAADSALAVTGVFDSGDKADGVIYSKSDLVLNGTAALTISSTENGVVGKDDLKITGGAYRITARDAAVEANDSIRIADGTLELTAGTDGLHAENSSDDALGYIYIAGGTLTIEAQDDGIHAGSVFEMNDGRLTVAAAEGVEATYVQINGGSLTVNGRDDGINAGRKSGAYAPKVEINGGAVTVTMATGDADGIDSNGDIAIHGGVVNVTGGSSFDCDGTAEYTGGTLIVNGQTLDEIPLTSDSRG